MTQHLHYEKMNFHLPQKLRTVLQSNNYLPIIGWGYPDLAPIPSFIAYPYGSPTTYFRPEASRWLKTLSPAIWPLYHAAAQLPVKRLITLTPDRSLEDILRNYQNWETLSRNQVEFPLDQPVIFPVGGNYNEPADWLLESSHYLKFEETHKKLYNHVLVAASKSPLLVIGCDLRQRVLLNFLSSLKDPPEGELRGWIVCGEASKKDIFLCQQAGFEVVQGPIANLFREIVHCANGRASETTNIATKGKAHRSPYRYLNFFERDDGDIFFGRDKEIKGLTEKISAHRLAILAGPSGSGKTSLINAGLLAWTDKSDSSFLGIYVRCGQHPLNSIRLSLSQFLEESELQNSSIFAALKLISIKKKKIPLIVLDQSEELFTQVGNELKEEFFRFLKNCILSSHLLVKFIISLRDDYVGKLTQTRSLLPTLLQNIFVLDELSEQQAIEAILGPASVTNLYFDQDLAIRIVQEFDAKKIPPPQVQIVTTLLFEARNGNRIDMDTYDRLGGTQAILKSHLGNELEKLGEARENAKKVLKSMVTSEGTKDIVTILELSNRCGLQETEVSEIILHLRDKSRLIRSIIQDKQPRFELAHEYLTEEIWTWMTPDEIKKRELEELLARELRDWEEFKHLRLGIDRLKLFTENHESLLLDEAAITYLLLSCTRNNYSSAIWLQRMKSLDNDTMDKVARLLFEYFWDSDVWQRRDAAEAISDLVPSVIIEQLSATSAKHRKAALEMAGGIELTQTSQKVISLLNDPDPDIPPIACAVLGELKTPDALEVLVAISKNGEENLRIIASRALISAYEPGFLPLIEENLFSEINSVRVQIRKEIIASGNFELLRDLLMDQHLKEPEKDSVWDMISGCAYETKIKIADIAHLFGKYNADKFISNVFPDISLDGHMLRRWRDSSPHLRKCAKEELKQIAEGKKEEKMTLKRIKAIFRSNDYVEDILEFFKSADKEEKWLLIQTLEDRFNNRKLKGDIVDKLLKEASDRTRSYVLYVVFYLYPHPSNLEEIVKRSLESQQPTELYLAAILAGKHKFEGLTDLIAKHLENPDFPHWYFSIYGPRVKDAAAYAMDILRPKSKIWRKKFQQLFKDQAIKDPD